MEKKFSRIEMTEAINNEMRNEQEWKTHTGEFCSASWIEPKPNINNFPF